MQLKAVLHSLMPTPHAPPGENRLLNELKFLQLITQKWIGPNEIARSGSTSLTTVKFVNLHSSIHTFLSVFSAKCFEHC